MWIVCITSVRHVLTVNGYGGRQTKENEKSWCFKGWETLVIKLYFSINIKFKASLIIDAHIRKYKSIFERTNIFAYQN